MRRSAEDHHQPQGDIPDLPADFLTEHLAQTDQAVDDLTFLRPVTMLETVDGEKIPVGLDEIKPTLSERAGHYWAQLDSHKKRRVLVTGAALLAAAGAGGYILAKNRTQRKKMKKR